MASSQCTPALQVIQKSTNSSLDYTDLKTAFAYDVEAARPMPTVPSKLNAQAHLMYFGAEADTMDDDEELVLGKEPSFLRDMNSSCLCFNKPLRILLPPFVAA